MFRAQNLFGLFVDASAADAVTRRARWAKRYNKPDPVDAGFLKLVTSDGDGLAPLPRSVVVATSTSAQSSPPQRKSVGFLRRFSRRPSSMSPPTPTTPLSSVSEPSEPSIASLVPMKSRLNFVDHCPLSQEPVSAAEFLGDLVSTRIANGHLAPRFVFKRRLIPSPEEVCTFICIYIYMSCCFE